MNKLLGYEVRVQLKDGEALDGVFFDSDEDSVYIQSDQNIVAIPRENVRLYISRSGQSGAEVSAPAPEPAQTSPAVVKQQHPSNVLRVFINDELVDEIPAHPNVNLLSFNEEIMKVAMTNRDVESAMAIEEAALAYEPNHLYITTAPQTSEISHKPTQTSFSMAGGGNIADSFVNPSQMVQNLNDAIKRKRETKNK